MNRSVLILCFFIAAGALFATDKPLCPQVASYTMDVKLDTTVNKLSVKEILSWTNTTSAPAEELWFHLYWNGFQNNKTVFLSEGSSRWDRIILKNRKEDWGYCRIDSIGILETEAFKEADLLPTLEFEYPDTENACDQTTASVKLTRPVGPGQTILISICFEAKIPSPIHRTGVYMDYYFIAQWFPKIGVFEEGKWNCHQFHANTNFFADYGTYDVRITLPSHFVIGATGEHREKIDNGDGSSTHRFVQHSVHDFAWTASPRFLEYKEDFEFAPGKRTEITLLLQPSHLGLKDRYMNAVKNSLIYCSLWYGEYPYSTVTCVDPAYNSRSGGMEYPTLFTGGTYFLSRKGISRPEGVTIHEFGHGYFYGLVGTNEFEHPWMDEGFTSFLDSEVYEAAYGERVFYKDYFGIPVTFKNITIPIESSGISRHRRTSSTDVMQRVAWEFLNRSSYGAHSYSKAELMLRTLKRMMGKDRFDRMMKAYSERNWFKHPEPVDFFNIVAEYTGRDMMWYFDQVVFNAYELDYAVGDVEVRSLIPEKGWFNGEFKSGSTENRDPSDSYSEVTIRRLGGIKVPVEILIEFEDGTQVRESWDGQYRWKKFSYTRPSGVSSVVVDPEFTYVLDINRTNNSWMHGSNKLAPLKWVSSWMTWLQHYLEVVALFGG